MPIQPRDYQGAAVQSIFDYFVSKHGNPVVAMPTGTGKSVVIALFLYRVFYHYPRQRVMVLTHVKELIEQNFKKLLEAWPTAPAGIYSSGLRRRDTREKIIMAGIASVAKRAAEFGHVDLVLVDEAHLVSPADATLYQLFFDALRTVNPHLKVIGLTATPWRLGQGLITDDGIFTDVCFDLTTMRAFNWLIAQGYLCPLVPKQTTAVLDIDGVHMRGGEYVASELQKAVDKQSVTVSALREALSLANDRKSWLLFCAGVDHAKHVAEQLTALGRPCRAVWGNMPDAERDDVIAGWKRGEYDVANNSVLTTGIDHPGLDCIVMLRPTASTVLWVQMLGRGTRPLYAPGFNIASQQGRLDAIAASDKLNCLVLDFAGNTRKLGPINDPVIPKKKGEKAGEAPIKLCPSCATYNHASARHCSFCGAEFPTYGPKVLPTAGTDELIKTDMPVMEVMRVQHVTYAKHSKIGRPPSVRVSHYCGLNKFQDYVCFEHPDQWSQRKAADWFRQRCPDKSVPVPKTVDAALELLGTVRAPTHIRVWVNKQHPQIMAYCFDGSAFGAEPAGSAHEPSSDVQPEYASAPAYTTKAPPPVKYEDMDDDIPF
jgi:DNA repair protein RadD